MIQEGTFYCEKCGKNTIVMREHEWENDGDLYGEERHVNHDRWYYEKWRHRFGKWSLLDTTFDKRWTYFAPLSEWADYDYWTCSNCKSQYAKDFTTFINQIIP